MYTIYSKPNCPNCETAKKILVANNQQFEEKKLDVDYSREYLFNMGVRELPYIVEGPNVIGSVRDLLKVFK